jgi:FkbM family methyltransferase
LIFKENLSLLYFILPFIFVIENKYRLIFSILFGSSTYKIKIKNQIVQIPKSRFDTLRSLLGCLSYAHFYSLDSAKKLKISFDENNLFEISLNDLSFENTNLIELLYFGNKYGANFITKENFNSEIRDQTFKISSKNNRKIITTSNGINFFLDSIHPGNTIQETFVQKIHLINSKIDWKNKIVVDVGAECGDTPLYFAKMGAKVFAFEALKKHYDFMMENLKLNSTYSEKIIPINAAIGKDGPLKFFVDNENDERGSLGASFIHNHQNTDFKHESVTGFQLSTARKKYQINHIDLLKMDCKGCEFFLTNEDLKDIDRIKIEYGMHSKKNTLENLLTLLKQNGFHCMIFRTNDTSRLSNLVGGTIFASRI